jgi:hypothetical protein
MEQGMELIEFYRENPCIAAYDLLRVDLAPIQRAVFEDMWFKNYVIAICGRGVGKTFMLGTLSTLSCMLYPGYRVGLIGPVFRQSKMIFSEVEKLYAKSPLLREACEKRPTRGSDTCYLRFKSVGGCSPSFIEALPLGDGCITSCNYLTFSDRFGKIDDAHVDNIDHNHYLDREDMVWSNGAFKLTDRSLCNGIKNTIKIKTKKGFESEGTPNHEFKVVRGGEIVWCRFDAMVVGDRVLIDRTKRWHSGHTDVTKEQAYSLGLLVAGCDSSIVNSWLCDTFGLSKVKTIDKSIPKVILCSSRDVMSSFIRGLMDGDGSISDKGDRIIFTNTSKELVGQLQYILLHYGIVAKLSKKPECNSNWNVCYTLDITGTNVDLYMKEIGFGLSRKTNKYIHRDTYNHYDTVPIDIHMVIDFVNEYHYKGFDGCRKCPDIVPSKLISRKDLSFALCDDLLYKYGHIDDSRIDIIRRLNNTNIYYDEIIEITDGEACTYDIHVPDGNEYCANGFFSHNSKIRGSRFYLIVVDELAQVPDQVLDMVVRPMGATTLEPMENVRRLQRQEKLIKLGLATEDDFEDGKINKMVMTSSGFYKFNHMWRRMKDYWRQMELHGEESQYKVWQVPYWDLPNGFLDENNIKEAERIMSSAEFSMEYEAAMVSDSEGFFKASVLESCTGSFGLEVRGEPGAEYVVGVDPSQGGSASCGVVIVRLGNPNVLVNVLELKGKTTQELTMTVQAICESYNVVRIFMDKGGGGNAIMDLLEEGYNSKEPIIDRSDKDKVTLKGRHILEMVNFNPTWITDANFTTLAMLEDKKLLFPETPVDGVSVLDKIYKNILTLKKQMLNIVVTQTGSGALHFDTPKKGQNKDLYSAMILAAHGCKLVARELEGDPEPLLYQTGGYVQERKPNAPWHFLGAHSSPGTTVLDGLLGHAILKNKRIIK